MNFAVQTVRSRVVNTRRVKFGHVRTNLILQVPSALGKNSLHSKCEKQTCQPNKTKRQESRSLMPISSGNNTEESPLLQQGA
jgi:hypothetical protein